MRTDSSAENLPRSTRSKPAVPVADADVRLSPRQCAVACAILVALAWLIPAAWPQIEPMHIAPDYRLPFRLGEDYWCFQRYCHEACTPGKTLVLGDSVIWGHYVAKDQTLSHYLNQ